MDLNKSGWQASLGQNSPDYHEPETIAQITVTLYGEKKGQSQVQVHISPHGPLATEIKRPEAYCRLLTILERELKEAFDILGQE